MKTLLGFSVQNYKSFKDTQKLSFFASNYMFKNDHILPVDNIRVLRSALIYGGNASGKTNLIKAIDFSHNIVLHGLKSVNLMNSHFRIDSNSFFQPGVFEYRILVDKTEYSYGLVISYEKKCIISEWLVRLGETEKYIFNRSLLDKGSIVETDIKEEIAKKEDRDRFLIYINDFSNNISESLQKKTLLSDLAIRGQNTNNVFKEIADIYDFFKNILVIYPTTKYVGHSSIATDDSLNYKFSKLLERFDTGIRSLECKSQAVEVDEWFEGMPKEALERLKISISNDIGTRHSLLKSINGRLFAFRRDKNGNILIDKLVLNHGNKEDLFELKDESDGTIRLFDLLPLLTFNKTATILIDEIERSLHPLLITTFLSLFYAHTKKINSFTQLIATTHEINLFDTDLIRLDELWLVKRKGDQSSDVYSLNKYKIDYTDNIKNGYLLGKYGAIPDIESVNSLLEEAFHE